MTDTTITALLDEAEKAQRKGHLMLAQALRDASDRIGLLEHELGALRQRDAAMRAAGAEIVRAHDSYMDTIQDDIAAGNMKADPIGAAVEGMRAALSAAPPPSPWREITDPAARDDAAVNDFAAVMRAKMAAGRAKGRGGWPECEVIDLWRMLTDHVEKGDPRDVACLAMMIWHNSQKVEPPAAQAVEPGA